MENNRHINYKVTNESDLFRLFLFRFLPYWPFFILLLILSGIGAFLYLKYTVPLYEISAVVMVKDETKGVQDSKISDLLNMYTSKKIVENEIEVIHSRNIMKQVVSNLYLYAPVWEDHSGKAFSAYMSSPIIVEAKDPDHLQKFEKIGFSYILGGEILIENQHFGLDNWVSTRFGVLRFKHNGYKNRESLYPLYFSLQSPKEVITTLLKKIDVTETSKLSTVITLNYKDEVPERGENIINDIIAVYNRETIADKNILAANSLAFVDARMKIVASGLDSIEKTIQLYKSQKGAVDLSEQGKLFLANVSDNDRKVANISTQLAVLDQTESYVASKKGAAGIVPASLGVEDPTLKQLLQKLSEAELKYENLKQTIPENNSILTSLAKEIETIRPQILESVHNQQASLKATKVNMTASGDVYSSVLQSLPSKEKRLLEISRQQSIENNVYAYLLQKREEMALSNVTISDSRVIDAGESSMKPVSPKKWLVALVTFTCPLILGIGFILISESLSSKILFRSDINKYTNAPIVAEITNLRLRNEVVRFDYDMTFNVQQFHRLSDESGLFNKNISSFKILITSGMNGDGKSFISSNLALSLAYAGKKVILIDADLNNPGSSKNFAINEKKGLSEYLNDSSILKEVIFQTEHANLDIIPAGKNPPNSVELLLKGNIEELFNILSKSYQYILIDTPSLNLFTNASIFAQYCDKTFFIVRHGYTPKTIVSLLDEKNKMLKDASIVFNGIKKRGFIIGKFGFGYGFGKENLF